MTWATTTDQLEIYYEDSGGDRPVIAFQSGYMGIHDIWTFQVAALKNRFRCITHDNRGHGLSSSPAEPALYTTQDNAEDLKAVLDQAGIAGPFLLVTRSLGATNAIAFASRYPSLLAGIVMMGGGILSGETLLERGGHPDMWAGHQATPSQAMIFYRNLGLREDIAMEAAKWPHHVFLNQTAAVLNFRPEALSAITVPVLVLHGTDDVVTAVDIAQEMTDALPNARLQLLEGANHFPQTEKPDEVNGIIAAFARDVGLPA